MAAETLEERVAAVEQELARLKQQLQVQTPPAPVPWWEKIAGTFADSEHYEEAMRLGREYRASQGTAALSEAALAEDWNRPEEDAAWSHLPSEP